MITGKMIREDTKQMKERIHIGTILVLFPPLFLLSFYS